MAEEIKTQVKEIKKKNSASVYGKNLGISTKYAMDICKMIRGKTTEQAIAMLEEVVKFKRPVKMNNREVPHKKGKGVMGGRYPIKAALEFIRLLKELNANALVNQIPIEDCGIACNANRANRPYRKMGQRFKRTHLLLKLELRNPKK